MSTGAKGAGRRRVPLPSVEKVQQELGRAESIDDFFGKEGIFAKLFAETLEQMLEAELTDQLGYEKYEAKGRNSGNSRNGKTRRNLRTSNGDPEIEVPRDRNGEYQSKVLAKHQTSTNELEAKILALYAKGLSTRDIQSTLEDLYGVEVSPTTISTITDKVWSLVEAWQNRALAAIYPIIDSLPAPVCKRVRSRRCRKVRGREFCGYCAAKDEKFFGWRLHLICTPEGVPVSVDLLPAAYHDLTPVHELTVSLPEGATVFGDKGYISDPDAASIFAAVGVRLVSLRRKNMPPNSWADDYDLAHYRKRIETVNSQLEALGIQLLHARTNTGFNLKVWATLLALAFSNIVPD